MGASNRRSARAKRARASASTRSFLRSLSVIKRILRGFPTRTSWPQTFNTWLAHREWPHASIAIRLGGKLSNSRRKAEIVVGRNPRAMTCACSFKTQKWLFRSPRSIPIVIRPAGLRFLRLINAATLVFSGIRALLFLHSMRACQAAYCNEAHRPSHPILTEEAGGWRRLAQEGRFRKVSGGRVGQK